MREWREKTGNRSLALLRVSIAPSLLDHSDQVAKQGGRACRKRVRETIHNPAKKRELREAWEVGDRYCRGECSKTSLDFPSERWVVRNGPELQQTLFFHKGNASLANERVSEYGEAESPLANADS